MKLINQIYINGQFVQPHGVELFDLVNPATEQVFARVQLADEQDALRAIAAAKAAYPAFSRTSKEERIQYLARLHKAVATREQALTDAMIEEYGGPHHVSSGTAKRAANSFLLSIDVLRDYAFTRMAGTAKVEMVPIGVVGLITPWNANAGFICSKLATAIAAGCTAVIKPSELSANQTRILTEALHEAGLPPGVFNIVTGRGQTVGETITRSPDVAKISFTGSTAVGKHIARGAVDTLKRVTLELGGKSPNIILDDANFAEAIPAALRAVSYNNGQACISGSRLLVPEHRLDEVKARIKEAIGAFKVGQPDDPDNFIGPLVTQTQFERVQRYIRIGLEEGAELVTGGEGRPEGLARGYYVKPTVFANVTPEMTIAKEEIFGPVLSILTYRTEQEAIAMANDTVYGLQAYVSSGSAEHGARVASLLFAGRVFVNGVYDEPKAPFGGFKQSGVGREYGTYGLEAYLEPRAVLVYAQPYHAN